MRTRADMTGVEIGTATTSMLERTTETFLTVATDFNYYSANYTQSLPAVGARVMQGATLSLLIILSVFGNSLVIYIILRHLRFFSAINVSVLSLSVSDLLTSLTCMVISLPSVVSGSWVAGKVVCIISGVMNSTLAIASMLTICSISIDRLFLITKVPKLGGAGMSLTVTILLQVIFWLCALIMSLPWELIKRDTVSYKLYYHCLSTFRFSPSTCLASKLITICLGYLIPTAVMIYSCVRIMKDTYKADKQVRPNSVQIMDIRFSGEVHTARTLVIMCGLCIFLRIPYILMGLVTLGLGDKMTLEMDTAGMWIFWTNCAVNPFVYSVRNPNIWHLLPWKRHSPYMANIASDPPPREREPNRTPMSTTSNGPHPTGDITLNNLQMDTDTPRDLRSDSIPSVLFYCGARKDSSFSTSTASTRYSNC